MAIPEKELKQSQKRQPRKRCHICGKTEPMGTDGNQHRFLRVADGVWECNYCNNQH